MISISVNQDNKDIANFQFPNIDAGQKLALKKLEEVASIRTGTPYGKQLSAYRKAEYNRFFAGGNIFKRSPGESPFASRLSVTITAS